MILSVIRIRVILAHILVLGAFGVWTPRAAVGQEGKSIVDDSDVNVTLLATNVADQLGPMTTQGEFSFAAWVEVENRAFLFDIGWAPDNVLSNAKTVLLAL